MSYTIGEAARAAGVTARAVRLYESKGLVSCPDRSAAGYRLFTDDDVEVLTFIRRGRNLGLSLQAIAEILAAAEKGLPCARTRELLARRLDEIDAAIADLQQLRKAITKAQSIDAGESAGSRCAVIEGATS